MKMTNKKNLSLERIINTFAELHRFSEDVHWLSSPGFENTLCVSPVYEKTWGRPIIDLYQDPDIWITHLLPEDTKHYHPLMEMAKRIEKEGPNARYHELYRIVHPTGEVRWILDRGQPIYSEEGMYIGVTGVASDITIQKEMEQFQNDDRLKKLAQYNSSEFIADLFDFKKLNITSLTKRELQCVSAMLKGKTAKEIAKAFGLSPRTIEHLIERIKLKLKCKTRSQLIEKLLASYS